TVVYRAHRGPLLSLAWSPDGMLLASGDTSGEVHVWYPRTGEQLTIYRGHRRLARSLAWSPDGALLASGGDFGDGTLQLWRATTGQHLATHTGQDRILTVAWSPDGQRLAACSFDGRVQTWHALSNEQLF